jgi:hypothetical protein
MLVAAPLCRGWQLNSISPSVGQGRELVGETTRDLRRIYWVPAEGP